MTYLFLTFNHQRKLFSCDKWGYMLPVLYFSLQTDSQKTGFFWWPESKRNVFCPLPHRSLPKLPVSHNFPISIYEHFFISGDVTQNLKQSEGKHPFEQLSAIHDTQQHIPHLNCSPWCHWIKWWNTSLELKGTIQSKKGLGRRLCEQSHQAEQGR